jgi:hypothetical protein
MLCLLLISGCDMAGKLKDGLAQSGAVADQIEKSIGTKPQIFFNYSNGKLVNVTATFAQVPAKSMVEIEAAIRKAVLETFKEEPGQIVVSFILPKPAT